MNQLMCHNHTPVNDSFRLISLLHQRQVQVVEISVIKEERFVLIESNRATSIIVEDVYRRAAESEDICSL